MEKPDFDGYQSSRGYYTGSSDGEHATVGSKVDAEAGQDLSQPWSFISLLKGVLEKLRGVLAVELTGSIPEYGWLNADTRPTPADPAKLAFGVEINSTTHKMKTHYWNGSSWQEVL